MLKADHMKPLLLAIILFGISFVVTAAPGATDTAAPTGSESDVRLLESKIRKAWDDYKNKRKEEFAAIFTEDAVEVEEGAEGAHDKKATLAEMDDFNLTSVSLGDFHYRPIGSNGMLVHYTVEYQAKLAPKTSTANQALAKCGRKPSAIGNSSTFKKRKLSNFVSKVTRATREPSGQQFHHLLSALWSNAAFFVLEVHERVSPI